jgi:PAS domain S-box-containing protein
MDKELRILHLEDSVNDAELIRSKLEEDNLACFVERVDTREAFTTRLEQGRYDVILCDYTMPCYDGLSALALAREKRPDLPFIFVSGTIGEDRAVETFKKGATDYVLKDNLARLVPSVRRALRETQERQKRGRAEDALRESEERYRALYESSIDAVVLTVTDGRTLAANPAACRMFGRTEQELCRLGGEGLVDAADPRLPALLEERASTGRASGELTFVRKDGSRFIGEVSSSLFRDRHGNLRTSMIIRDSTEKRKLEGQLRQAQKMEAVGQLTSGIAHDFNNILSAIIGYGNLLQMKLSKDDPLRAFADQILVGADRAANLTRSLLTFSRKQITNLLPVNANELVKNVEKLLQSIIGEDIDFRTALDPGGLMVNTDAGQIEQVLMNLATNARDAMPKGGILSIETGRVGAGEIVGAPSAGEGGPYALISVTDTGVGMDEKTREKIFEPFFTTKDPGRGTGLGLSMVYGIIKQHGGHLHCYSEPGKGTTFKVYLPLVAAIEEKARSRGGAPVSNELPRGTETVLVAEDDEALRRLSTAILRDFGYTVIEAMDGEDAVRKFREHGDRITLVLCDVIMPGRSGGEVRAEIGKLSPGVRVLFMSGYPADIIREKGLLDDKAEIILKPVAPTMLLKKVREALDKP